MKLLTKFNLLLLALFAIGGLIICAFTYNFLINNARREVLREANLMMASARSVRDYTATDLAPLLQQNPQHKERFLPETVPAFAAINTFQKLRQVYPDYSYNEATMNPTNPAHRAVDWEADIIRYFRDRPNQKQLVGERESATGPSLYLATPIIAQPPCLECHSRPALAPPAMIASYGSNNGFGWQEGTIVAAQIVSVPMALPVQSAKQTFHHLLAYILITLIAIIAILDLGVYYVVIRPLKLVSKAADQASKGQMSTTPLVLRGKDEIADLTASFNRMQISLAKAFKLLS